MRFFFTHIVVFGVAILGCAQQGESFASSNRNPNAPSSQAEIAQYSSTSFFPSRQQQEEVRIQQVAAQLEITLLSIPDVVSAKVHIAPAKLRMYEFSTNKRPPLVSSASVLLVTNPEAQIDVHMVSLLVSGAMVGLQPKDVKVVVFDTRIEDVKSPKNLADVPGWILSPVKRWAVGGILFFLGVAISMIGFGFRKKFRYWLGRRAK